MRLWPFKKKSATEQVLSWVTSSLAVGHAPMSYQHLELLKQAGINAILNLCAELPDLPLIEKQAGFEVYYLPVQDEETPEMEAMDNALEWLDEAIFLGKKVLVHCRFGIGRTGTLVSAYLLRKGLSPRLTRKKLSRLKSSPANYTQWSMLRTYRKQQTSLKMREPSLEQNQMVDLAPFFADLEAIFSYLEEQLPEQGLCGREHMQCCSSRVQLSLAEAVYISNRINTLLSRENRRRLIHRAVHAQQNQDAGYLCPLSLDSQCCIFMHRPLACRLFDAQGLSPQEQAELQDKALAISQSLFLAFGGSFLEQELQFELPRVLSGKYVQDFFYILMQQA
ncbi:MAG: protein-tyrosine phosphatase family protein [Desulfohalobiaceae bacterium]